MPLRPYQKKLALNTLYEVSLDSSARNDQVSPSLEVVGGTVNVLGGENDASIVSVPTNMDNTASGFRGIDYFAVIPNYLYIQSVSGTPVVTVSGLYVTAV